MVPHGLIIEQCNKFDCDIVNIVADNELVTKIMPEMSATDEEAIIKQTANKFAVKQSHILLEWTQKLRMLHTLQIGKEIQKNEWFEQYLEEELKKEGYEMMTEYSHNQYCIFGKPRPHIFFARNWLGEITAGVVMQPEPDEFLNTELSGGTIECKVKDLSGSFPQAIANMVRVACNLLRDALKFGKIVKSIVKSITIFGLLVSYKNEKCIPLKYLANFEMNSTQVYVGEKIISNRCSHLLYLSIVSTINSLKIWPL